MVLSQSRCRPLGLVHRVRVHRIVAGDDQRIDFGEREIRQVVDVHVERGGQDLAGVGTGRRAVADVARGGLVEEDREVDVGRVDDLDVMRVRAGDEVDVALF